jgi:nucleotide-binding universal stress UspA family protein
MKEVKRIVVGIDIFEKSTHILKRALMLAARHDAEVFVLHAVKTPWFDVPKYFGSDDVAIDTDEIAKKIEKQIKKLNKTLNVSAFVFVKMGDPVDIIQYEAKLLQADMIILGGNKKRKALGAVAEKVAHQSHLPVLVVKNSVKGRYQKIVAPTDFQTQSKLSIAFAKNVFENASLKPVHSLEEIYIDGPYSITGTDLVTYNNASKIYARNALSSLVRELSTDKGKLLYGNVSAKKALITYINKGGFELTVIGSQGTSGLSVLLGSMALSILRETQTDVLVYVR